MKFCSKCGKEIHDEAVICIYCGCAVADARERGESNNCVQIRRFCDAVKPVNVLSIVGIVLCLGIGIIFAIISEIMRAQVKEPIFTNLSSSEIGDIESAKRKLNTAKILNTVTCVVFAALLAMIVTGMLVSM